MGRGLWIAGLATSLVAVVVVAVLRYPGVPMENEAASPPPADDAPASAGAVYDAQQFDRLLGRPLQPVELSVAIGDERVAVSEIPSTNSRVRIYQIEDR